MATPKKTPQQKLNIRERRFVKAIAEGYTPTEAMKRAGYAETTAYHKQSEKLAKVGQSIQALCEKQGLTDELLLDTLKSGLFANKLHGEQLIEAPDWQSRLKATDLGLKLKGHMKDKVEHSGPGGTPIAVANISTDEFKRIAKELTSDV